MTKPKPNSSSMIGAHWLILSSLGFIRAHWKKLFGILAVAAVANLVISFGLGTEAASLYQSLWFVFISCAVIWTIRHLEDKHIKVSLAKAYYTGTAPMLRFFLTLIVVGLATLPFSIGAYIYGAVASPDFGGSGVEKGVAAVAWLALALLTLVLLARLILSLLIVTLPDIRPVQSLKLSWQLVRGQTRAVAVRLAIFSLYLLGVWLLVILGLSYLPTAVSLSGAIINLLFTMLVLPLGYIYLYQLYHAVKK